MLVHVRTSVLHFIILADVHNETQEKSTSTLYQNEVGTIFPWGFKFDSYYALALGNSAFEVGVQYFLEPNNPLHYVSISSDNDTDTDMTAIDGDNDENNNNIIWSGEDFDFNIQYHADVVLKEIFIHPDIFLRLLERRCS